VVSLSDAGADPWAMVVESGDTTVANVAVEYSRGLQDVAGVALFQDNLVL